MSLEQELAAVGPVRRQEAMARHTTMGVGGAADFFVTAPTREALRRLVQIARRYEQPAVILGSGSNLLVGDGGIRGMVIENQAQGIDEPEAEAVAVAVAVAVADGSVRLRAESGVSFASLSRRTARQGLSGLEWAAGIPGTLGGAAVYNAGAYGGCLADVLAEIEVGEPEGRERTLPASELGLAYRGSAFTRGLLGERAILSLTFTLQPGNAAAALARIEELEAKRKAAQPHGRNAGSIFKNPSAHPAWWLIDRVGLRGHRIGDAGISEQHTNWIVNLGTARAAEVTALMELARQRVRDEFGIELEAEIARVGEGFA